jgi:carbamoyltransferase
MFVLGVNSAYHEPAAALLEDGRLVSAAEEERFNRVRHGKRARVDNADDLPWQSIVFCLEQASVQFSDVDFIAYSFDPWARRRRVRLDTLHDGGSDGFGTEAGEEEFLRSNLRAREGLRSRMPQARFEFYPHHLCHAASAFFPSPFSQAGILIVDGIGESASAWTGYGVETALRSLTEVEYPHSLGFLWEKTCEWLGYDRYDGPGKVMALGSSSATVSSASGVDYAERFASFVRPTSQGCFEVDPAVLQYRQAGYAGLENAVGPRHGVNGRISETAAIAAALQQSTERILLHMAGDLYDRINCGRSAPVTALCMAGGVALNCVANQRVLANSPWEHVWVQPAAHDAGTALGAALLAWHSELGNGSRTSLRDIFLGPSFDVPDYERALIQAGLRYSRMQDLPRRASELIARGKTVGWFQGRMEFGPRALGNRSILADPRKPEMRTRLNRDIKMRESFRPFAPSVLAEEAAQRFTLASTLPGRGADATEYMLLAVPVAPGYEGVTPAVEHTNLATGETLSRVHAVRAGVNPLYEALLSELKVTIGAPMVLNTSFNVSEPIVCTPSQACATFLRSTLDALALGPFLVTRF